MTITPINPDHFVLPTTGINQGAITPQPWMQYRWVHTVKVTGISKSFNVVGAAHDDLIHIASAIWKNSTPISQRVYGMVTRGGCRVTLQARTRAYLKQSHSLIIDDNATGPLVEVSSLGCGMVLGRDGALATDVFGIIEVRQATVTLPLMPEHTGWLVVPPQGVVRAQAELRFVSDFWQDASISGGNQGSESSYSSGDTRIDLFAIPVI